MYTVNIGINMGAVNFNPQINERLGKLGAFTVNPTRVAQPQATGNEYGINIPQNHSYTTGENGDKISMGLDGVGLAHRNPDEFNLHVIA